MRYIRKKFVLHPPLPFNLAQLLILAGFGENDYLAFANTPGNFPPQANEQDRAWDIDYDKDGIINLFEAIIGTSPSDPNDFFRTVVSFFIGGGGVEVKLSSTDPNDQSRINATNHEDGFRIDFRPYQPNDLAYTLYKVFQGDNNDERVALSTNHTMDVATGNGYFLLPFNTEGLTNEIVAVGADDPDFVP